MSSIFESGAFSMKIKHQKKKRITSIFWMNKNLKKKSAIVLDFNQKRSYVHWHLMVVFPCLRVTPVHCNLVSAFSIVLCCFACKILDACVFAMNFCAFCMIIENKRKNLAQQRNWDHAMWSHKMHRKMN